MACFFRLGLSYFLADNLAFAAWPMRMDMTEGPHFQLPRKATPCIHYCELDRLRLQKIMHLGSFVI
jgi:hypothetical protein